MKGLKKRFVCRTRRLSCVFIPLAISGLDLQGPAPAAAVYTLSDHNSSINLDLGSSAGLNSWSVDSVNQANQQWFWFRVGSSGPQSDLSAITASPFVTTLGTKQLTALYTNASLQYGVQVQYTLAGQANGSGKSG